MSWIRPKVESEEDIDRYFNECKGRARFLIDESLGMRVTTALRDKGWNVKDVSEVGLNGHSDEDIFAYAKREDRILLTHDSDFLDDKRYPMGRNPGVIVLPGADGSVSALSRALGYIYPHYPFVSYNY
jgi:predicted nuclease of predicted toxin-antitoxin system